MTEKQTDATEKFIDPICGMTVSPETARGELEFEGQKYYFCSKGCLETFKQQKGITDSPLVQIGEHHSRGEMR
ncbi:MAG: YHS domain-containing protein, partial [Acidobacteriota bacterium]|nr:YHS domain-containing protein [Acidobacteriota bacterium]